MCIALQRLPYLFGDGPVLKVLTHKLNLTSGIFPEKFWVRFRDNSENFEYWKSNPKAILFHQYDFINSRMKIPEDFFQFKHAPGR